MLISMPIDIYLVLILYMISNHAILLLIWYHLTQKTPFLAVKAAQ